ncbi:MAG: indolepyruvate ferredoxin oxidoreductase subunit alpha [Candidatus Geothermincolia bacterium]
MVTYQVDPARCDGCHGCAELCPAGAIRFEGGTAAIDPAGCIGCGICFDNCPAGAVLEISSPAPLTMPAPTAVGTRVPMAPPYPSATTQILALMPLALKALERLVRIVSSRNISVKRSLRADDTGSPRMVAGRRRRRRGR